MLISIVTVCLNNRQGLLRTLSSIEQQDESLYESLVIDGGSTDGSQRVVGESKIVDQFVSEPDSGIYEAMNKGVRLAHGDYVIFLNSGDIFYSENVIQNVVGEIYKLKSDLVFGDAFMMIGQDLELIERRSLDSIWKRMPFSHQALFTKLSILKNNLFDETKVLAGDYKFIYSCYRAGCSFEGINLNVSILEPGGISESNRRLSIIERFRSVVEIDKSPALTVYCFYIYHIVRCSATQFVKRFSKLLYLKISNMMN